MRSVKTVFTITVPYSRLKLLRKELLEVLSEVTNDDSFQNPEKISGIIATENVPIILWNISTKTEVDNECENCGIINKPLTSGFCKGCTCLKCGKHGSMNSVGWCDICELKQKVEGLQEEIDYMSVMEEDDI